MSGWLWVASGSCRGRLDGAPIRVGADRSGFPFWDRSVAEGAEDEASATMLRDWGCDYASGDFFHKPAPSDAFVAWIEANARRSARF